MPQRIAFCITELDPGGAEWALWNLVTRLPRKDWLAEVFCLGPQAPLVQKFLEAEVPVTCLGAKRVFDLPALILGLRQELRRFQPDLIQTWLYHANLVGRFAARCERLGPVISGIRVAERRSRWRLRFDRWTEHWVDRHVCVSQGVREHACRAGGLSPEKLVVIPNGVQYEKYAQAVPRNWCSFGLPAGARVLLTVGRLDCQKGLSYLLSAVSSLLQQGEFPDLHLVLVGEGPERQALTDQISQLSLNQRVHLLGWRADVPELMRAAKALVLPSLWEGLPNVVLEAMAAGLPVVAAEVDGVPELVLPGQSGWLVPPQNVAELTSALRELLQHPERSQAMGLFGQQQVQQQFTWDSMSSAYEQLYRERIAAFRAG